MHYIFPTMKMGVSCFSSEDSCLPRQKDQQFLCLINSSHPRTPTPEENGPLTGATLYSSRPFITHSASSHLISQAIARADSALLNVACSPASFSRKSLEPSSASCLALE